MVCDDTSELGRAQLLGLMRSGRLKSNKMYEIPWNLADTGNLWQTIWARESATRK